MIPPLSFVFFPGLRDVLRKKKKKAAKVIDLCAFFRGKKKKRQGIRDEIICSVLKGGRQSRAALKALRRGAKSAGTSKDPRIYA